MWHNVSVRIDAGKLRENPLLPEVLQILQVIRPSWMPGNIGSKELTGGITNILFAYYEDGKFEEDVVLIRVEGEGTDQWADREEEKRVWQVLHKAGLCAPLYAAFENGIAYGYIHGEMLDVETVRNKQISNLSACIKLGKARALKTLNATVLDALHQGVELPPILKRYIVILIAEEMCRLHAVRPVEQEPVPGVWKLLDNLVSLIPEGFPNDPDKQKRYEENIKPKHVLEEEYKNLREHLEAIHSAVVFCHTDLLVNNIIYNKDTDRVHFIDYEFAMYNYEHYDIAHHFCEYTGVTEKLDFSKYPDKAYQIEWIKNYLGYQAELRGKSKADVTHREIEDCYAKINKFALLSLFLAGTWAIVQANTSKINFDYMSYGIDKFREYYARREEYFALELPK